MMVEAQQVDNFATPTPAFQQRRWPIQLVALALAGAGLLKLAGLGVQTLSSLGILTDPGLQLSFIEIEFLNPCIWRIP